MENRIRIRRTLLLSSIEEINKKRQTYTYIYIYFITFNLNYNMNKDDLPNDIGNRFSPTPLPFLSFSLFCSLCSPIKNEFQSPNELTYKVLEISRIFSGVTQYPRYEITRRRCRIYTRGKNQIGKEHDMVSFLEISSRGNVACIEKKSSNGAAMTNDKQWSST